MSQPLRLAAVLAFLAFPILEIGLLIRAGQVMGFWRLALIVVATAVLGSAVIRNTGFAVLTKARAQMDKGGKAFNPLFDGLVQLTAGMLLIFPGLISDFLGLLLLVPAIRHVVVANLLPRLFTVTTFGNAQDRDPFQPRPGPNGPANDGGVTIEGEYERVSEEPLEQERALKARTAGRRSKN